MSIFRQRYPLLFVAKLKGALGPASLWNAFRVNLIRRFTIVASGAGAVVAPQAIERLHKGIDVFSGETPGGHVA